MRHDRADAIFGPAQQVIRRTVARDLHVGDPEQALFDGKVEPCQGGQGPDHQHDLGQIVTDRGFRQRLSLAQTERQQPADDEDGDEGFDLGQPQPEQQPVASLQGGPGDSAQPAGHDHNDQQITPEQHRRSQPRPPGP